MQIAKVLSTQTPAQIKKHAESLFKQNLKTNSAAVKRYQESLSSDEIAQVLVKHAAEQQKYQESLSSEDKAQMLTKKADTERKQSKYLPPEKKVNILETNAAAHKKQRKSLSPDNKVQILNRDANAHKKKQESLSPDIKTYLSRITLLHNTNIVILSLLIRKLKYLQEMLLNTKSNESLSLLNRKFK